MRKTAKVLPLVFVCITLCICGIHAQQESYMFNHFKSLGETNVVYFSISGLDSDNDESRRVLELLLENESIYDGNIYFVENSKNNCQLDIAITVTVSDIRTILQSAGYDIDLESVTSQTLKNPEGIYSADFYTFDKSFDAYKTYDPNDSKTSSEQHYANEKDKWISEHPEEYKNAKENNGKTVIVNKKDWNSFSQQKREYILKHPEIFIIEE